MKTLIVLLVCGALFGCRKRKTELLPPTPPPPAGEAKSAPVTQTPSQVVPPPAAPVRPAGPHPGEPLNAKEVRAAYHQYFEKVGNFPNDWQEMVKRKFIPAVPMGKNGQPLDFAQFTFWEAGYPAK